MKARMEREHDLLRLKDDALHLRIPSEAKAKLRRAAHKANLTLSAWVRRRLRAAAHEELWHVK